MSQRTFLTGIALSLLITQACGSDPGKRHNQGAEGGAGGEAAGGEPAAPGGNQNTAGTLPLAGKGGMLGMAGLPEGGAAGTPPAAMAGAGGEAGAPVVIPPDPELLFTVKPNAGGLVDSAVSGKTNPENFIYSSRTGSQDKVDGTNTVAITGADLGLADTDQIVSFTALQVEPTNPTYLFSVADGSEGAPPSRVYAEYWSNTNQQNYADVYFSDGSTSFRYLGEGGDEYGYNGLLAHERSLGLSDDSGEKHDDLTGLLPHDANKPLTELYFIVTPDAVGAQDSAVATMNGIERGCSIFKSKLDGKNELVYSCLQLGLTKGDQIDALLVYGTDAPEKVTFSVTQGSTGSSGTAVAVSSLDRSLGATLFQSTGNATNTLFKKPLELGLNGPVDDEIDALAVIDVPKGKAEYAGKCDATYDLFDAQQGGFTSMRGTLSIGNNVIVAHGQVATQDRLVAYDATSCAMLQQLDIPSGLLDRDITALVPLTGWSAQKPLDKIELYKVETDDQASGKELRRYDTAGTLVKAYPLIDTYYAQTYVAVVYDPVGARLYLVQNYNNYPAQLGLAVVPMPDAQATDLTPEFHQLTMPCTYRPDINGVDAQGNLYLAQYQADITYRVCAYKPNGEMLPLPYVWTPQAQGEGFGFIVGQGPHFQLTTNGAAGPISIERDGYLPPTP